MSEEITRLEHTGFVSKSCAPEPRPYMLRRLGKAGEEKRKKRPSQAAVYLAVRLAVCVLLFAAVVALKLSNGEKSAQVLSLLNDTPAKRSDDAAQLGKLRFVEIPSIIEVFAPTSDPVLPAEASAYSLLDDDTLLRLEVKEGARVASPCSGTVIKVGEDEALGAFVAVNAGNDTEFHIFGIADIAVESGQPLTQNSILGRAAGDALYVRAYKKGSPENPLDFFSPGKLK